MRTFLLTLLLAASSVLAAPLPSMKIEACGEHLPYGVPSATSIDSENICRFGYALQHDNVKKVPLWVAYSLTPDRVLGCYPRTSGFSAEPSVPRGKRAEDSDYTGSGYDRGHMAPNNDMRWHMQVEDDANVLSNTAPQAPGLNRGAWKQLEDKVRAIVYERRSPVLVYSGPIFSPDSVTIGEGKVAVPASFFKVLVDQKTKQVLAYIYPNTDISGDPELFRVSYAEVVRQAGFILPLPSDPVMSRSTWPTVEKSLSDERLAACTK